MKRICSLLVLICLILSALPLQPTAAAATIGLFLNGEQLVSDVPPVLINGRTLIPLRVVSESLGANVKWTSNSEPIVITKGADEVSLRLGASAATRNGETLTLDVPAQMVSGRTMVPVRFILEGLGAQVKWVASPPSVLITSTRGELSKAEVVRQNSQAVALKFTSTEAISLGQAVTSPDGKHYTIAVKNIVASAETVNGLGVTGLTGYSVTVGADFTATVTLTLGTDAGSRKPKAELSADGKTLTISWPLTMKQATFVQTGGVESLSFGVPAMVTPQLTDTTVELAAAGSLVGRANADIGVNLRSDPSTALPRIALVKFNEVVTVIGETTGWYQVRLADDTEGWMSDQYTAVDTVIEEEAGVNVRQSAGTSSAKIATLYAGEKITVLERQTGWDRVSFGNGKTGWIADYLVPLASRLTQPTTTSGLKLFFPGVQRDCQLTGAIAGSRHIAAVSWQDDSTGTTAILQLKHAVDYRLRQENGGWALTFGTWVNGLSFAKDSGGLALKIKVDGKSQPKVVYVADSQSVLVTVPNASLAKDTPVTLSGDGVLVSSAQTAQVGGDVRVTVKLVEQTAYRLGKIDDSTWEVVFASPTLVGKTIALDPGHGATDPGAMGLLGMNEKDYTQDIVARLRTLLQAAGANVVVTREAQSPYIEAHGRAALINQSGADLFVSVHVNSYTNRSVSGLETYYYPRNDNERFARLVQNELVSTLGWLDRGVKSNTLYILPREALATGVLAEVGFISNADNEGQLYQPDVRQRIAEALYRAVESYFEN